VRFKKLDEDAEQFMAFPVLAALARRAMTTRQLTHILLMGREAVVRRLKELEKAGYVVKRSDSKWVLITRLAALGVPSPSGILGITPTDEVIGPGEVTENVVLEPYDAPGKAQEGVPDSPPVEAQPKSPSEKIAAHFDVPLELDGAGVAVGKIAPCKSCGKPTPLKYGNDTICPRCAKVWGKVTDVQD
jgi:DNA-binding transcriptional ArsR family regulator